MKFISKIFNELFDENSKAFFRKKLRRRLFRIFSIDKNSLQGLGKSFGTDKSGSNHSFRGLTYLDIYESYFQSLRSIPVCVLEIGVKEGDSLRLWKKYFTKGRIFGIDIDPGCKKWEEARIKIETGSQDDLNFLAKSFPEITFDIIIDDGSHINQFTLASFKYLFNHRLNPGGLYIIEDLKCSYERLQEQENVLEIWPGMKYNDPHKNYNNDREDMNRFFLEKIKKLDHLEGDILFVHFWAMTCVIGKV